MMTSDPTVVVVEDEDGKAEKITSPTAAASARSPMTPCTPSTPMSQEVSMVSDSNGSLFTPQSVKRAGTDISNLPVSTPKRPKQVKVRRSPAEIEREKKEKEDRRLERVKQAEEARIRKEAEQKRKDDARLKREEEKRKRDEEKLKRDEAKQLALKAKQEEKDKKEEERLKKEDERKKKEDEKKAVEDAKKKEKEAKSLKEKKESKQFLNFFKSPVEKAPPTPRRVALVSTTSRFPPFQVQPGMTLAPILRRDPLRDTREFDQALQLGTCDTPLYLVELADRVKNQRYRLVGPKRKERESGLHPKMLQFKENHRPAYWGTWRRKSKTVRGHKPFARDDGMDYEYDSEAEWEEEEPGESLSDSEGEEKEKEDGEEDEEDNDGFLVPHGYLSDDERDGSDLEQELDPQAAALLRKVAPTGGVLAGPEQLKRFPVVPLLAACPVNPLAFTLAAAAPTKKIVTLLKVPASK
eukprot:scpid74526/ scgid7922/ Chromatin assembly factor 1 subunit A-A; Chromatin assembly factor I p150 subunit A